MLYPQSHMKFSRAMFPWINPKLIRNVDHSIDNPSTWEHYMNVMQNNSYKRRGLIKNPYDIFNLTGGGHRKYNHDLLTGSLLGSVHAMRMGLPPSQGMFAAFSHYATDSLSNKMVDKMGTEGRNLFEAVIGLNSRRQNTRRRY